MRHADCILQATAILSKLPRAQLIVTSVLPRARYEGDYLPQGSVARWTQVDTLNSLLPAALAGLSRTTLVNCDSFYLVRKLLLSPLLPSLVCFVSRSK